MKKLFEHQKEMIKLIFSRRRETKESFDNDIKSKTITGVLLALVALVMTIVNAVKGVWDMFFVTLGLVVIFIVCVLLVVFLKKRTVPSIILAISIGLAFSYFALFAKNEGFAILWIILVPLVSMMFINFKIGVFLSLYFLLFVIAIFYTPLKEFVKVGITGSDQVYGNTFMLRFPLLYLGGFLVSLLLAGQKTYYSAKSEENALYDSLTMLKNRRFYNDYVDSLKDKKIKNEFTIISADLNNLKIINDKFGHTSGDKAIIAAGDGLKKVFGKYTDYIFRTGGDEFVLFFSDSDDNVKELVKEYVSEVSKQKFGDENLGVSVGTAKGREYINEELETLINIAEKNMYKDKEEFYKRYKGERRKEIQITRF